MSVITSPLYDPVCMLKTKPFGNWNEKDQLDLINIGRPIISIVSNKRKHSSDFSSGRFALFRKSWYDKYVWLCGSTYLQSLHCWPCLLFSENLTDIWVCDRISSNDGNAIVLQYHEEDPEHVKCNKRMFEFINQKEKQRVALEEIRVLKNNNEENANSENVPLNRQCAQFAVDAVLLMIKKEMLIRDNDSKSSGCHADLVSLLVSQCSYEDVKSQYRKQKACQNPFLSTKILHAIIESIADCIDDYIEATVKTVPFYSVRVDNGLNETNESSMYLRLIDSDNAFQEYFLGNYNLGQDLSSLSLFRIIDSVLEKYQYKTKLIGVSYDITCVKFNYLKDLRVGVKFMAQQSVHTNLLAHSVDHMIEKCLCNIPACRLFFADLHVLFSIVEKLYESTYSEYPDWRNICYQKKICSSRTRLLGAMVENWALLKDAFEAVQRDRNTSDEDLHAVSSMLTKFKDYRFVFLCVFIQHLFQVTETLNKYLRAKSFDTKTCHEMVKATCVTIYRQRTEAFYNYISNTAGRIMSQYYSPEIINNATRPNFKQLYYEVIDNIIMELHTRFHSIDKYAFLALGNSNNFESETKDYLLQQRIRNLCSFFPDLFKFKKGSLMAQWQLVRQNKLYWKLNLTRIIRLLSEHDDMQDVHRLFKLIILLTPANKGTFPCLHQYRSYFKTLQTKAKSHLVKIIMNKEILNILSKRYSFKDDVLNKLSLKFDDVKLSHMIKSLPKDTSQEKTATSEDASASDFGLDSKLFMVATDSDMVVEVDPSSFVPPEVDVIDIDPLSQPGPSSRMEPDSSMMEDAPPAGHVAVKIEPDSQSSTIKIKQEPPDDLGILSATVEKELNHFTQDTAMLGGEESLFQPPALIKDEIESEEEM